MNDNTYICPECKEGRVAPRAVAGRKATAFPGLEVELSDSLVLETCDNCLHWTFPEEQAEEVQAAIDAGQLKWQAAHVPKLIEAIKKRDGVTQQRVATALGVTPEFLSNVSTGSKLAKKTVLRLLHAFADNPAEFNRTLAGEPLNELHPTALDFYVGSFATSFATPMVAWNYDVLLSSENFLFAAAQHAVRIGPVPPPKTLEDELKELSTKPKLAIVHSSSWKRAS